MKIDTYTTSSVFDELQHEWNDLLSQAYSDRVFLTCEWQSSWWQAYQPGDLWVLAVRNDQGQLVGLAPWFIKPGADDLRVVHTIGCVDVTDYLEVIAHKDCEAEVFAALAEFLKANLARFDKIDLCNIPQASTMLQHFPGVLRDQGFTVEVKQQEVCPVIDLPPSFADYVNGLDKKDRHELRRKMRKIDGIGEGVEWYIVGEEHDLSSELENFLDLMRSASQEKAEFLGDERNLQFFRDITSRAYAAGWLQLAFMIINNKPAAAYLNFDYHNDILVYNSGLDLAVASNLSPGIVLLAYLIRHAIEKGRRRFDFLRGDEEYKYRMGGKDTDVFMLLATVPETIQSS
ncbi:MAG: GNAT family N-acetyltransferase [Chloroflexi bacterium]|nr:GNAT family N-acetyltransferase [Chloroflexota bacterium]